MGMDVYGRNPKDEDGKYFRSGGGSWDPLQTLMIAAGWVEAIAWGTNDGLGLPTQPVCDRLADKLEEYLDRTPGVEYLSPLQQARKELDRALPTCRRVDIADAREFIVAMASPTLNCFCK
jgi:hypothetical protein